jgi:hypothetical protein
MKLTLELIPWTPPTPKEEKIDLDNLPMGAVYRLGQATLIKAGTGCNSLYLGSFMFSHMMGDIPKRDVLGILGPDGKFTEYDNTGEDLVNIFDFPPGVVFEFPEDTDSSVWWITTEGCAQCLCDAHDKILNTGMTYDEGDFEDDENLIPRSCVLGMLVPRFS